MSYNLFEFLFILTKLSTNQWIAICAIVVPSVITFVIFFLSKNKKASNSENKSDSIANKILEKYGVAERTLGRLEKENKQLKAHLRHAIQRIKDLQKGLDEHKAKQAIDAAKKDGDATPMFVLLIEIRNSQRTKEHKDPEDWVQLNKEICTVGDLKHDLDAVNEAADEILKIQEYDVEALKYKGDISYYHGDYNSAEKYYKKMISYGETKNDEETIAFGNACITPVYEVTDELWKAELAIRKAIDIWADLSNMERLSNALIYLGKIHLKRKNVKEAARILNRALETARRIRRPEICARADISLGECYRVQGEYQKSERLLLEALNISEKRKDFVPICDSCNHLGLVYLNIGDLEQAEKMFLMSLEKSEILGWIPSMIYAYGKLIEVYNRQENPEKMRICLQKRERLSLKDQKKAK